MLALDTTMGACSVALVRSEHEQRLWRALRLMERGHAEALFPMIAGVMDEARLGFEAIDRLAVTTGPGTFTGIRLGVAAVRGLALAMQKPVVAATALEVIAARLVRETAAQDRSGGLVVAVDARRGEIYTQVFSADGAAGGPVMLASPEESAARLGADARGIAIAGSAAESLSRALAGLGIESRLIAGELLPDAADLALLALNRAPESHPVTPLYLRAPDAKPQAGFAVSHIMADEP